MENDTIAAIATALSDSGIGIIRVSGSEAVEVGDKIFRTPGGKGILKNVDSHTIHYGYIVDIPDYFTENDEDWKKYIVDEVMVSVLRAPKSFTAEDTIEINCHGGVLVMQKILQLVCKKGARLAEPGEFTKRAFLNGRIDLSKAEAVMDLIHSKNETALKSSMDQLRGNLSEKVRMLRKEILHEIAFIESALDDPEHFSLEDYPEEISKKIKYLDAKINDLLKTFETGKLIKEGISTVILGKPNAGKSSLLNMILGEERAIVTDIAGTTRDALQETVRFHNITLNIIDTAGIRDTADIVEKMGVEKAKKYAMDADLILYVVDSSVELDDNDREILSLIKDKKVIILLNKMDLVRSDIDKDQRDLTETTDDKKVWKLIREVFEEENRDSISLIHTSAKDQTGMDQLEQTVKEMFFSGMIKNNDEIVITNIRHKEALENAGNSLKLVQKSIDDGMPEDFFSIDLMSAYISLGLIIGEEIGDDLVEEIFSKFCMGK